MKIFLIPDALSKEDAHHLKNTLRNAARFLEFRGQAGLLIVCILGHEYDVRNYLNRYGIYFEE